MNKLDLKKLLGAAAAASLAFSQVYPVPYVTVIAAILANVLHVIG